MKESTALIDNSKNTCLDPAEFPTILRGVSVVPLDIQVHNPHVWYGDEVELRVHFEKEISCPNKVGVFVSSYQLYPIFTS